MSNEHGCAQCAERHNNPLALNGVRSSLKNKEKNATDGFLTGVLVDMLRAVGGALLLYRDGEWKLWCGT